MKLEHEADVSITFTLVVLDTVGMLDKFGIYYLIVCLVGIVCAIICPYLYPLRNKPDTYLVPGKAAPDTLPEGYKNSTEYGMDLALKRVAQHKGIGEFFASGAKNACSMWFGVLPTVMAVGTVYLTGKGVKAATPIILLQGNADPAMSIAQYKADVKSGKVKEIYDLAGRRVLPTTKGLVIKNGHVVLNK